MSLVIEVMSERRGPPCRVIFSDDMRAAATIGSALFLLPLISILPLSREPPRIRNESMISPVLGPKVMEKNLRGRVFPVCQSDGARPVQRGIRSIGQSIGRRLTCFQQAN